MSNFAHLLAYVFHLVGKVKPRPAFLVLNLFALLHNFPLLILFF